MVEAGIYAHVVERAAGACLGIGSAEDQASDPGRHQRPRAHQTRLEGDDHRRTIEAPAPKGPGRVLQRQELGVRGGVAPQLAFVVPGRQDLSVDGDNGTNRHVPVGQAGLGLGQGPVHGLLVRRRPRHHQPR